MAKVNAARAPVSVVTIASWTASSKAAGRSGSPTPAGSTSVPLRSNRTQVTRGCYHESAYAGVGGMGRPARTASTTSSASGRRYSSP